MPVEQSIGQIAQYSGKQQRQGNIAPDVDRSTANQKDHNHKKRKARERDEKCVIPLKRSECRPGISDVYDVEKVRDLRPGSARFDIAHYQTLRQLIEQV